jgi:hypothetical protein
MKEPDARAGKGKGRYGRAKGSGRGYEGGINVNVKFVSLGLLLAIRAAPAERVSSPGYLTMVK